MLSSLTKRRLSVKDRVERRRRLTIFHFIPRLKIATSGEERRLLRMGRGEPRERTEAPFFAFVAIIIIRRLLRWLVGIMVRRMDHNFRSSRCPESPRS